MTTNILEYKELIGSVNYSDDDECYYGKIEEVNDLVTFEGVSLTELKKAFKIAVEDYLELRKKLLNHS